MERGDPQITVDHLEEIMDNLFKVLDDPVQQESSRGQGCIAKIVDDVIAMKDPGMICAKSHLFVFYEILLCN